MNPNRRGVEIKPRRRARVVVELTHDEAEAASGCINRHRMSWWWKNCGTGHKRAVMRARAKLERALRGAREESK